MVTAPSAGAPPPEEQRPWWRRPAVLIPALATLLAAVLGPLATATLSGGPSAPAGTGSVPPTRTGGRSASVSSGTSPATPSPTAWVVDWTGTFEIGLPGVDFDDQPPGAAAADVYYNGSLATSDTTTMATWPHPSAPTATQCDDWVRTHPDPTIPTVTVGEQICLRTMQGRAVVLRVDGLSDPQSPPGITTEVTVWQHP